MPLGANFQGEEGKGYHRMKRYLARIEALEKSTPVDLSLYRRYFDFILGDGPALAPEELDKLKGWALLELIPLTDTNGAPAPATERPASLA